MAKDLICDPRNNSFIMAYEWIKNLLGNERGAQTKLAQAIGLTQDKLNKVFAGTRDLGAKEALAVANYFKVPVEWVITGESSSQLKKAPVSVELESTQKKKVLLSIELV